MALTDLYADTVLAPQLQQGLASSLGNGQPQTTAPQTPMLVSPFAMGGVMPTGGAAQANAGPVTIDPARNPGSVPGGGYYAGPTPQPSQSGGSWSDQAASALAQHGGSGAPAAPADTGPVKVNYTQGGTGDAGASAAPLNIPKAQTATIAGHEVSRVSPGVKGEYMNALEQQRIANEHASEAQGAMYQDLAIQQQKNDADARSRQAELEKSKADFFAKDAAARTELAKNIEIDPDHYMSKIGGGGRALLGVAAGLTQAGMALAKNGGPNPVMQMIENNTREDIEAQKDNAAKHLSMYHLAREQGMGEVQAKVASNLFYTDQAQKSLDTIKAQHLSPMQAAEAEKTQAALDLQKAALTDKLSAWIQPQTVSAGGISKGEADEAKALTEKGMNPQEALRTAIYHHRGSDVGSGPMTGVPAKGNGAANSRALGTLHQYQNAMNEADSGLSAADEINKMITAGGQVSPTRTAKGQGLRTRLVNSISTLMAVGSKPGDKEIEMAEKMVPKDPNAWQWSSADKAQMQSTLEWLREKKSQTGRTMQQLGTDPFSAPTSWAQAAQQAGATDDNKTDE